MTMNYLAKIKNNKVLLSVLKEKSLKSKKEICGFIYREKFIEKENIHPDPVNYFLISPKECIWQDDCVLFHSHPAHIKGAGFSEWDLENQYFFNMDMVLYSVNNDEFYYKEK